MREFFKFSDRNDTQTRRRRGGAVAVVALTAALIAGCGGNDNGSDRVAQYPPDIESGISGLIQSKLVTLGGQFESKYKPNINGFEYSPLGNGYYQLTGEVDGTGSTTYIDAIFDNGSFDPRNTVYLGAEIYKHRTPGEIYSDQPFIDLHECELATQPGLDASRDHGLPGLQSKWNADRNAGKNFVTGSVAHMTISDTGIVFDTSDPGTFDNNPVFGDPNPLPILREALPVCESTVAMAVSSLPNS